MKSNKNSKNSNARAALAVIVAAAAALAGCAGQPTVYYSLAQPLAASEAPLRADQRPLYVELAPIALPERLARAQMVVRKAGTPAPQVDVLEEHRWTSSFDSELRDALAARIAGRLGAVDATKSARPSGQPVWRIAIQVRQFDAVQGSRVDADFSWTARDADAARRYACQLHVTEPVGASLDDLAAGAQKVTATLGDAVAAHIAALRGNPDAACPAPIPQ